VPSRGPRNTGPTLAGMAAASLNAVQRSKQRVTVALGDRSYEIVIGRGLIDDSSAWQPASSATAMVVTNPIVGPLYRQRLERALQSVHRQIFHVELPDGEEHKDWMALNTAFDALLRAGCDRDTTVYALGGGVVGDIAGFAAACFMRGIAYVQVPTTLLAQVDSSVGGKTAINHPLGKNMIGAFHQPQRVVCDLDTLATLPERELRAGLAEVVKYGPIADWAFFEWLERHASELAARDPGALQQAVVRSCEVKADVVSRDEREGGLRAILNFGHTFGHAIEVGLGYGTWLHGEAVAAGMVVAAQLSADLSLIDRDVVDRLVALLARFGLPTNPPRLGADRYVALMRHDKKAQAGELRFTLLAGRGRAVLQRAPEAAVRGALARRCA
jgi:3-dehydroquinate synthase